MKKKIVLSLIVISISIFCMFLIYRILKKERIHTNVERDTLELTGDFSKKYPNSLFPVSSEGNKYTLAFFIYNNNYAENSSWDSGFIRPKGIISHYGSPNVYFITKSNTLRISIAYKDDLSNKKFYNFDIKKFKYQKWEHVVIVVENKYVSIYLNGVIIKATKLPNIPWIPQSSLFIGQKNNNFNGKIRDVEYINDSLKIHEVEYLFASKK